jgi:hypothetical protein
MATHEILGVDIFREGASIAFKVPYNQVTSDLRAIFKERFDLFTGGFPTGQENMRAQVKRVATMMRTHFVRGGI